MRTSRPNPYMTTSPGTGSIEARRPPSGSGHRNPASLRRVPCGRVPSWVSLLLAAAIASCASPRVEGTGTGADRSATPARAGHLAVAETKRMLAEHPDALILDVRQPEEWNDDVGHIEGARLIPLPELNHRITEIAAWRDKPVIVVCRVGVRSAEAANLLVASGFHEVYNLEGGMEAWRRAGS